MRGRTLHFPVLHALAPCSTPSHAFLSTLQPGRGAGSACTPSICLRQGQTLPWKCHKYQPPCQELPAPGHPVQPCLTPSAPSQAHPHCPPLPPLLHTHADIALSPPLTTPLPQPWPHLPPSPPCRAPDPLPATLSLLTAPALPPPSLSSPLTAPCLLSHSPSKNLHLLYCSPPSAAPAALAALAASREVLCFCLTSKHSLQGDGDQGIAQPAVSSLCNAKQGCSSSAHKPMHAGAQHARRTPSAWLHPHLRTPPSRVLEALCSAFHPLSLPAVPSLPATGGYGPGPPQLPRVPTAPHHLLQTPTPRSHPPSCHPGPAWAGHGAGAAVPPGTRSRAPRSRPCWTRTRKRYPTRGI